MDLLTQLEENNQGVSSRYNCPPPPQPLPPNNRVVQVLPNGNILELNPSFQNQTYVPPTFLQPLPNNFIPQLPPNSRVIQLPASIGRPQPPPMSGLVQRPAFSEPPRPNGFRVETPNAQILQLLNNLAFNSGSEGLSQASLPTLASRVRNQPPPIAPALCSDAGNLPRLKPFILTDSSVGKMPVHSAASGLSQSSISLQKIQDNISQLRSAFSKQKAVNVPSAQLENDPNWQRSVQNIEKRQKMQEQK